MLRKLINSGILTTPFLRFTTDSGVDLDPVLTAASATFEWISPDGSVSTGTTPNPTLDQTGAYTIKCSDWSDVTQFDCRTDHISAIGNLHVLSAMTSLRCEDNSLLTLNVSGLTLLTELSCRDNSLEVIDISTLIALNYFYVSDNLLTVLDVSALLSLKELHCHRTTISILDVSALTTLVELRCYTNTIATLNVSALTSLTQLLCYSNGMDQTNVDKILADLVIAGVNNGTCQIHGTNAIPSAAGLTSKGILEGRGWTVTVSS